MTTTQGQFLVLLRAGLWGQVADKTNFDATVINWHEIFELSRMQAVMGVVYDGIMTLPANLRPDKKMLIKWYSVVVKIEQKHEQLNHTLANVISLYHKNGFSPILLKGQGCAANYVNPLRRQCGDLDIWVGESDFRRVNELIASKGIKCIELNLKSTYIRRLFMKVIGRETWLMDKHMKYLLNGVTIENHRILTRFFNPKNDRRFVNMARPYLENVDRILEVEGEKVTLLPINFDVIYVLYHAVKHYMLSGVGFRQLCDWARMLHVYYNQIDVPKLQKEVRRLRLQRAWGAFGYLAVHYMGMPIHEMPLEIEKYAQLGNEIFACVMKEGNFGINKMAKELRPIMYHRNEKFSLKWLFKRIGRLGYLYPSEERWLFVSDLRQSLQKAKETLK